MPDFFHIDLKALMKQPGGGFAQSISFEAFHSAMHDEFTRMKIDPNGDGVITSATGVTESQKPEDNELARALDVFYTAGMPSPQDLGLRTQTGLGYGKTAYSFSEDDYITALYKMIGGEPGAYNGYWGTHVSAADVIANVANDKKLKFIRLKS